LGQQEAQAVLVTRVLQVSKAQRDSRDNQEPSEVLGLLAMPDYRVTRALLALLGVQELLDQTETLELLVYQVLKVSKEEPGLQDHWVMLVQLGLRGRREVQGSRAAMGQRDLRVTQERLELQVPPDHRVLRVHLASTDLRVKLE